MTNEKQPPTAPRSLIARGSKPVPVVTEDEDGNWRLSVKMSRVKFDDKAKGVFLDEYRKHGRMPEAAFASGVQTGTVKGHMKEDEEFAAAVMVAEEEYNNLLMTHFQDLVMNGTEKSSYDRTGNLVSTEQVYPIPLIQMEMKKRFPEYKENHVIAIEDRRGVLVVPSQFSSVDDWEKRFAGATDVTPEEDDKEDQGPEILPPIS